MDENVQLADLSPYHLWHAKSHCDGEESQGKTWQSTLQSGKKKVESQGKIRTAGENPDQRAQRPLSASLCHVFFIQILFACMPESLRMSEIRMRQISKTLLLRLIAALIKHWHLAFGTEELSWCRPVCRNESTHAPRSTISPFPLCRRTSELFPVRQLSPPPASKHAAPQMTKFLSSALLIS